MVPESLILGSTLGINQNKWALKASQMRLFFICCHIFGIGIIVYDFSKFFPNLLKKKKYLCSTHFFNIYYYYGYPKPEFRVTRSLTISYLVGPLSLLKDTLHQNSQHSSTHSLMCVQ